MTDRHFVKYTFLKVDPAWRRLDGGRRARDKREFLAACEDFVVAFDTDDAGAFLDLVQRLRSTEASSYTLRDTPSFTCIAASLERALNALDGEALVTALT